MKRKQEIKWMESQLQKCVCVLTLLKCENAEENKNNSLEVTFMHGRTFFFVYLKKNFVAYETNWRKHNEK